MLAEASERVNKAVNASLKVLEFERLAGMALDEALILIDTLDRREMVAFLSFLAWGRLAPDSSLFA